MNEIVIHILADGDPRRVNDVVRHIQVEMPSSHQLPVRVVIRSVRNPPITPPAYKTARVVTVKPEYK